MVEILHSDGVTFLEDLDGQEELGSHVYNLVDPISCDLRVNGMLSGGIDWVLDRMQTGRAGGLRTRGLIKICC
jgi:hypothetical protein